MQIKGGSKMKKLATLLTSIFVVLTTAIFAGAESASSTVSNFPYFQLGCLVIGGMIIVSLKAKFERMYAGEAMGAFALYTILIALFTTPVINLIKTIIT
jgi:hypothetical protein